MPVATTTERACTTSPVEVVNSNPGERCFSFRTNVDELVTLDADHPLRIVNDSNGTPPYLTVREGLEARLTRSVYYELVALGHEETIGGESLYGIWSKGIFHPLGKLDDLV